MDLTTFHELLTPAGQAALADAAAHSPTPTEAGFLAAFEKLRKRHPPALAKAALETVLLRAQGPREVRRTPTGCTSPARRSNRRREISRRRHRARRLAPFGVVADLCCGIGGDALAFAAVGLTVHAVESDPLRLAMAEANAPALGLSGRISFHLGDALTVPLPGVRAAFADPSRRTDDAPASRPGGLLAAALGAPRAGSPDLPLAVKIAPGVARSDVENLDAEVEFVSVDGELKECVLWFGPLRTVARRATLLPSGATLAADEPPPSPPVVPPGRVPLRSRRRRCSRRAGRPTGERNSALTPIDHTVMLFTSAEPVDSPFVTAYRVEIAARFNATALRDHLRERGVGRVTIVKRGSSIDADELVKKLKLAGRDHRVVVLTRAAGEPVMIVGERYCFTASSP